MITGHSLCSFPSPDVEKTNFQPLEGDKLHQLIRSVQSKNYPALSRTGGRYTVTVFNFFKTSCLI